MLECKIEKYLQDRGHKVLWTPPYCPDMQPIETFWAFGKNHVARLFEDETTMKQVVSRLRDGWYGNADRYEKDHAEYSTQKDCSKLVKRSIRLMDTHFISLVDGISGKIGALEVDPTYERDTTGIPIDSLVVDLTKEDDDEVEIVDSDTDVAPSSSI